MVLEPDYSLINCYCHFCLGFLFGFVASALLWVWVFRLYAEPFCFPLLHPFHASCGVGVNNILTIQKINKKYTLHATAETNFSLIRFNIVTFSRLNSNLWPPTKIFSALNSNLWPPIKMDVVSYHIIQILFKNNKKYLLI